MGLDSASGIETLLCFYDSKIQWWKSSTKQYHRISLAWVYVDEIVLSKTNLGPENMPSQSKKKLGKKTTSQGDFIHISLTASYGSPDISKEMAWAYSNYFFPVVGY